MGTEQQYLGEIDWFIPIPLLPNHYVNKHGDICRRWPNGLTEGCPVRICKGYRYLSVPGSLMPDGKAKSFRLARLICMAFHGLPSSPRLEACHINDIKNDDRSENLKWGTRKENSIDASRNGRLFITSGEKHGMHKLTQNDVDNIRKLLAFGARGCDLAKEYKVSRATITLIKKNINWRNL